MNVIQANADHASFISKRLSSHFIKLNSQFGYNRYKTDYDKILEHVTSRLSDPNSEFRYFLLASDTGETLGFVNTINTPILFEILVLDLLEEYDTYENTLELAKFAINTLKQLGADKILTETSGKDDNYSHALETLGARPVEKKYIIN